MGCVIETMVDSGSLIWTVAITLQFVLVVNYCPCFCAKHTSNLSHENQSESAPDNEFVLRLKLRAREWEDCAKRDQSRKCVYVQVGARVT